MIGKIACSNVLSDLYAMGVTECDNMLMLLAVSTKMTEKERDVVIPLMMRGFKDCALEAGKNDLLKSSRKLPIIYLNLPDLILPFPDILI